VQLCFATHNSHKLKEIQKLLGARFELSGLSDIGCKEEIPETGGSLQENALIKAQYIAERYKIDCFADDTGLEVEALNGAPGVFSARYAGEPPDSERNIDLVLAEMGNTKNRKARFKTVIALIIGGDIHYFEGIVEGTILLERNGVEGFGYDAIFVPNGYKKSFAQMTMEEKNAISHRGLAVGKLVTFLLENNFAEH
jgi:XTP/dITP diphosphohydrolase